MSRITEHSNYPFAHLYTCTYEYVDSLTDEQAHEIYDDLS